MNCNLSNFSFITRNNLFGMEMPSYLRLASVMSFSWDVSYLSLQSRYSSWKMWGCNRLVQRRSFWTSTITVRRFNYQKGKSRMRSKRMSNTTRTTLIFKPGTPDGWQVFARTCHKLLLNTVRQKETTSTVVYIFLKSTSRCFIKKLKLKLFHFPFFYWWFGLFCQLFIVERRCADNPYRSSY